MFGLPSQLPLFLILKSAGVGFLLGLVYLTRKPLTAGREENSAIHIVLDIVFCIISSFVTFLFILDKNYGVIRGYIILSELSGFFILLSMFYLMEAVKKQKK